MKYIIGSRGSRLALIQTKYVQEKLAKAYPEHSFEIEVIKTKGDKIQNKPLDKIGGKGLFVKEIEEKIISGEIHMGVHSMKDMPSTPAKGLVFTKSWKREDPRDVLILRTASNLSDLRKGAVIGTGSKRRAFQLLKQRPDLKIVNIRGNVDTRLRKMEEQELDGIILAAAGLKRLGMQDVITQYLEPEEMISAPAQGVLALEVREDQKELQQMLDVFSDEETMNEVCAERNFLEQMGGSCHTPAGARCQKTNDGYRLDAMFGNEDGNKQAYTKVYGTDPETLAKTAVKNIKKQLEGIVYLIGAGPGDPELITVKGKEILKKADCVIYDRLIPQELLDETKAGCECIYVGKENHHHTMKQEQINELLAEKALQYDIVVRLKGGDPFVFGRGGEEAICLANQEIHCEVIPGISSCIAAAELAGIPVTHRGISKGFRVVTAHDRRNQLSDLNFASMAKSEETLVFLMGLTKLEEITTNLLKKGMNENTPVAVISNAASAKQKTCTATLNMIQEKADQEKLSSPAVIVVGDVVKLQKEIQKPEDTTWHLVTKVGDQPSKLAQLLKDHGYKIKEFQTGEISYKKNLISKEELAKVTYLIFTSRYGVHGFMKQMKAANLDLRNLYDKKIVVVGEKTKDVLMEYGIVADLMPKEAGEVHLCKLMKQEVNKDDVIWYCKGISGGEILKETLESVCQIKEKIMYENKKVIFDVHLQIKDIKSISFTCASSVRRFFDQIKKEEIKEWIENIPCISIGEKTTKQLKKVGVKHILEAKDTTYLSMFDKIKESML